MIALLAALCLATPIPETPAGRMNDLGALQGKWELVNVVEHGRVSDIDEIGATQFVFKGTAFKAITGAKVMTGELIMMPPELSVRLRHILDTPDR